MAPNKITPQYLRGLIKSAGITQGEAARRLHVLPQTLRRWLMSPDAKGYRECPWAAAELLRRMAQED